MTSMFLGQILVKALDAKPETRPETTLQPIVPGAWAAWAKAARDNAARDEAARTDTVPLKPQLTALASHR